jgi:hypothetical protein
MRNTNENGKGKERKGSGGGAISLPCPDHRSFPVSVPVSVRSGLVPFPFRSGLFLVLFGFWFLSLPWSLSGPDPVSFPVPVPVLSPYIYTGFQFRIGSFPVWFLSCPGIVSVSGIGLDWFRFPKGPPVRTKTKGRGFTGSVSGKDGRGGDRGRPRPIR